MKYNNLYNFKNTVKNFLNINKLEFTDKVSEFKL